MVFLVKTCNFVFPLNPLIKYHRMTKPIIITENSAIPMSIAIGASIGRSSPTLDTDIFFEVNAWYRKKAAKRIKKMHAIISKNLSSLSFILVICRDVLKV